MELRQRQLGFVSGVAVIVVYLAFALAAYLLYPSSYLPSTDWLSNLGSYILNPRGAVFYNIGVILTGVLILGFVSDYVRWYEGQRRWKKVLLAVGQVSGLAAGISLSLTGLFPLPTPQHGLLSMMFTFNFGDFLVFSTAALLTHPKFIRPIAYFALVSIMANLYFSIFNNTPPFEWLDVGLFLSYTALMASNFKSSFPGIS